jgi:hypothetical protein
LLTIFRRIHGPALLFLFAEKKEDRAKEKQQDQDGGKKPVKNNLPQNLHRSLPRAGGRLA